MQLTFARQTSSASVFGKALKEMHADFRAQVLRAYRKRPHDDACPSEFVESEETLQEREIENPQVAFDKLYVRLRAAMTDDILGGLRP